MTSCHCQLLGDPVRPENICGTALDACCMRLPGAIAAASVVGAAALVTVFLSAASSYSGSEHSTLLVHTAATGMGASGSKKASGWGELNRAKPTQSAGNMAVFGAGCYWGTEAFMVREFKGALTKTAVGFMGPPGSKPNPSYHEVCSGTTGHVEVLAVEFDPAQVSYEQLVRHFFTFHDPTTKDRQGNDVGTQYASVIFVANEEQREVADKVIKELDARLAAGAIKFSRRPFANKTVTTHVADASTFYAAHEEHQRYLEANPSGYCNHGIRFKWEEQPKL
mmetsp:Transcript_33243/g.83783  ORF Transcript_33243/g.83783 Transcript_33243/m.83783 type:complete len:280 (+) Transcript_33243:92-931(+)